MAERSAKKRSAPKPPDPDKIVDAALRTAARDSWNRMSLAAIADEAGVSLAQLHEIFPSRGSILRAFVDRVDAAVLKGVDAGDAAEPLHDRLLDVLMRRFEALSPHKDGVAALVRSGLTDPCAALCMGPRLARSMAWSLEAAGIGVAGIAGRIRVKGLAGIYLSALAVWLRDDTPDMGRTMAHIDKSLKRAGRIISLLPRTRRVAEQPST